MKNKLSPQALKRILVVIGFIVALGLLVGSRGFRYTTYTFSYVVQATGKLAEAVTADIAGKGGVARVDRSNNTVYFQDISIAEFNQTVTKLKEQYKDKTSEVTISSYIEQPTQLVTYDASPRTFTLFLLFAVIVLYFSIWRKLDKQDRGRIVLLALLAMITASITAVGVVSLVSQFTMVSEVTAFLSILGIVITLLILVMSTHTYLDEKQVSRVDAALDRIFGLFYSNYRQLIRLVVVVTLVLMLALGFRFVLDGAVMLASFFIASEALVVWVGIWYSVFEFDWRHIGGQINAKQQPTKHKKSK